jgi:hypothetical protein
MFKVSLAVIATLVAIVFFNQLPDIRRYLRIRSM